MENPLAPKNAAFTYALIMLLSRLVATQANVFNIIFGRRAYERTRGAMITMLYQKALSRKSVSISSKPQEEDKDTPNGAKEEDNRTWWRKVIDFASNLFRKGAKKPEKAKEFATTGKILNLIR